MWAAPSGSSPDRKGQRRRKVISFWLLGLSRVSLCHASVAAAGDDGGGDVAAAAADDVDNVADSDGDAAAVGPFTDLEPADDGDDDGPFADTTTRFSRLPADDQGLFRDPPGL